MKINVERGAFLKALNHAAKRCRTPQHHPDPFQCPDRRGQGPAQAHRHRPGHRNRRRPARRCAAQRLGHRARPYALRHRAQAAGRRAGAGRTSASEGGRLAVSAGSSRFELSCLPREDFPDGGGRPAPQVPPGGGRPQAHHRQDALRHFHRRNPLLPQRHLLACRQGLQAAGDARRGHRRPSPGPLRNGTARRRRRHAGRDRAAQDGGRVGQAAGRCRRRHRRVAVRHQDPVRLQRRRTDLQADRRQFPAL